MRLVQVYAYYLQSKTKTNEVALIYCKAPNDIIKTTGKIEDGLFVSKEDLNEIEIVEIKYIKASNIY